MGSSLSTKLKVGFTSILAVVVLVGGIFWVKQYNPMVGRKTMTVVFDDGRGIYAGDPVKISGIKVGEVVGTTLRDDHRVLITFSIRDDIRLAADTRFLIRDVGLMGDMMLIIEPGASPEEIDAGAVLHGEESSGIGDIIAEADGVLKNLNRIAGKLETDIDLAALSSSFEETLKKMRDAASAYESLARENRGPLNRSIAGLEASTGDFRRFINDNNDRFEEVLSSFRRTSDKLSLALDNMENLYTVVDTLSVYMGTGEGTLGRLVKSEELYEELRRTNANIDSFVTDFKRNPGKYTKDLEFKIRLF
ncbi:MAG: MCE family protein [Candidatus Latescibacteria bacterium]|nr:MCE family protein [Candidatus Latescibacterota bacterium]